MPTKDGDMKPTLQREHRAADRGEHGGDAEREDLEVGDAVAGEAHPVLLVAHRHQDAAELGVPDELGDRRCRRTAADLEEVEDDLAWSVRMSQPFRVRRSVMPLMPPV
jgi:hypothetical protein